MSMGRVDEWSVADARTSFGSSRDSFESTYDCSVNTAAQQQQQRLEADADEDNACNNATGRSPSSPLRSAFGFCATQDLLRAMLLER